MPVATLEAYRSLGKPALSLAHELACGNSARLPHRTCLLAIHADLQRKPFDSVGSSVVIMRQGTATDLLERAHTCVSRALQLDYLSNGAAHQRSAAPANQAAAPSRRTASPAVASRDNLTRYLEEIATRKRLSSSEEYRLATAARAGNAGARRKLIEHQLRLVVMMARRYRRKGLPLLDLIEEGNIGLMTAIEKFDPERGHRFSTYAKWWIRQSIELALMTQSRVVHVPVHVTRALKRRARKSIGSSTHEPIRDETKLLLYDASDAPDSRTHAAETGPSAVIERLPAPEQDEPDWHVLHASMRDSLRAAIALLNPNERVVIEARFGVPDDQTRTLESLARQLRLSSERIRQIQSEALGKLRRILLEQHGS
jgi:RNA polymerase nonessential primary-like sigma factor